MFSTTSHQMKFVNVPQIIVTPSHDLYHFLRINLMRPLQK